MSITGALLGFAIVSILVGVIGAIASGTAWADSNSWDDNSPMFKRLLVLFVGLIFIGGIIAGGVG